MQCRDHDCKPCSKMFARVESQESYWLELRNKYRQRLIIEGKNLQQRHNQRVELKSAFMWLAPFNLFHNTSAVLKYTGTRTRTLWGRVSFHFNLPLYKTAGSSPGTETATPNRRHTDTQTNKQEYHTVCQQVWLLPMLTLSSRAPPSQTWTIFFLITAIMVAPLKSSPSRTPKKKGKKKRFEFSLFEPTNPYLPPPPHPKQPCWRLQATSRMQTPCRESTVNPTTTFLKGSGCNKTLTMKRMELNTQAEQKTHKEKKNQKGNIHTERFLSPFSRSV